MKIQFLWFNAGCPVGMNIGVSLLSRELSEAGHEVRIIHLSEVLGYPYDAGRICCDVRAFDPAILALSFGSHHLPLAEQALVLLRQEFPTKFLLCGGVHCTLNPEEMIQNPHLDAIGIGECDAGLMVRFVEAFEQGDYFHVPSFWVRQGLTTHKPPQASLPDITDHTFLDFERIDYGPILAADRGFASVITGRGCPKRCTYCHNDGLQDTYRELAEVEGKVRFSRQRSVDNLLAELHEFRRRYPEIKVFNFADDTMATYRPWLEEFAPRYAKEIGLPYICCAIAQQCSDSIVRAFQISNCNLVKFGVESAVKRLRKEIVGRFDGIEGVGKSIRRLHDAGINVRAYVMFGMPTESPADMLETIQFCAEQQVDTVRPSLLFPFPGTRLYDYCTKRDLLRHDYHPYNYSTKSVLKQPPELQLFTDKLTATYSWQLNAFLNPETRRVYTPLLKHVEAMSREEWEDPGTLEWVWEEGRLLSERLRSDGTPHYATPFPDRPDVIFLVRRRPRPLINVDTPDNEPAECAI